jgi:ATPase family associated with various cellular activities (AAA)
MVSSTASCSSGFLPDFFFPILKTSHLSSTERNRSDDDTSVQITYSANSRNSWAVEPIRAVFGAGAMHYCSADGPWDLARVAETFSDRLVRSRYSLREDAELGSTYWVELCVQLDERLFIRIDRESLSIYAQSPALALSTAEQLIKTFRQKAEAKPPTFQIVKKTSCGIDTEAVRLDTDGVLTSEALDLHYGEAFGEWHEAFVEKLETNPRGLSIFDGPPGTGKTSYLRQLMLRLKESHRFYFIGSANLHLLRDAEFVDFWASERRLHEESSFVVILEDAESALMPRSGDNREEVSLLLNVTDGILGQFLKLQIICTINCHVRKLDSALLRPGRLLAHRHFGRLTKTQAEKLARHLGKSLPSAEHYSLAEVFNEALEIGPERPPVGFGS